MLQAQLQEEQALLAKASVEKDSEKPSLMKSKKMFRISESTNHILEEAFEKEKQDRMNIKRRLNYAYNYMAKVMFKNFKRRNKDDECKDDSSDSSSDASSINRRGPTEPYKGHHAQRALVFCMAVCE
jgi:lysyl-tRNA synthetase class I